MTKNNKLIILILTILLVFGILVVFVFDFKCPFKSIFTVPCPGCGLTRGFRALFHGNIIEACSYNILTIPIFLFLIVLPVLFLIDIIKKESFLEKYLSFFVKHFPLITGLIIISWIINIIRGI